MINIYTDGSCQGNPGRGGWAAIVVDDEGRRVLSGSEMRTTNNRMELVAAIRGLDAVPRDASATVHSDSQYLVNTMTRNWKRKANLDLWAQLDSLTSSRDVKWRWVRGHAGHPENEEANTIAGREAGVATSAPSLSQTAAREVNVATSAPSLSQTAAREVSVATSTPSLSHLDSKGHAQMVDVGEKAVTHREASARGFVSMKPTTLALITSGKVKKGDVLSTARLAGIMAAKQTPQLIPLCHTLPLSQVTVELEPDHDHSGVEIEAMVKTDAKTGVEMEALTAVSVAALTVYDMCKSVDRGIRIQSIRLVSKSGGKSGDIVLED